MEYKELGRTGLKVSRISLGTEYLWGKSYKKMKPIMDYALDKQVNYFDIVFSFSQYLESLGKCFEGKRDKLILTGHFRSGTTAARDHKYNLVKGAKDSERFFNRVLKKLKTDYIDIGIIQMVNSVESYNEVIKQGGVLDLAQRYKKAGKIRYIGMSMHKPDAAIKAIQSGFIDVLMYPINIAWDMAPGRREVCTSCKEENVGLVAMKGFAGGRLFLKKAYVKFTPTQCLHYILTRDGISNVVVGVKSVEELEESLNYYQTSKKEKEFKHLMKDLQDEIYGICIYCSHCQPCPAEIDIAGIFRKYDRKMMSMNKDYKKKQKQIDEKVRFYNPAWIREKSDDVKKMKGQASDCTECGLCMERCPFDVDVIAKMKLIGKLND